MKKILIFAALMCLSIFQQLNAQLISDFKVNDAQNSYQRESKIGTDAEGNFVITWIDAGEQQNNYKVFMQRYTKNAVKTGSNFMVSNQLYQAYYPQIAMKPGGNFFLCWYEDVNGKAVVKLKYFNKNGDSLTNAKTFFDYQSPYVHDYCNIGLSANGNLVISWLEYIQGSQNSRISFQRFDSAGNKIGVNVFATDTVSRKDNNSICVRDDGSFIITWKENRYIMIQKFDSQGNKVGEREQANDNHEIYDSYNYPVITCDSLGRFCVGFEFYNVISNSTAQTIQFFNSDGSKRGINQYYGGGGDMHPVKLRNGKTFINQNWSNRARLFELDTSGNFIRNFLASTQAIPALQYFADYKIVNNKIITTWTDTRNGKTDIYCNVRSYLNPDSVVSVNNISTNVPGNFNIYQNFPNPFNPTTKIKFDIPKLSDVKIIIFDAVGREVKNITQNNLTAGSYEYEFNGENLSSGIYYFKLQTNEYSKTMKMALVK